GVVVASREACDDGNVVDGDGCSRTCEVEGGWSCSGSPSVCMDMRDGGVVMVDGGGIGDAGVGDAAVGDGGLVSDVGLRGDAGGEDRLGGVAGGACGCRTHRSQGAPGATLLILLAVLVALARRRRIA
ncbi:MAG: MYXO-CTERM sorting domain-containing protein, partial [Sandaracinaceae bacterium]|nr:MYXO-CTERM sorting domain-containing protein [Sandaracinaceae bacterium]